MNIAARNADETAKSGSLVVIGTGIRTVGQLTGEAIGWMKVADALLYVISEPIAEAVIRKLNPDAAFSISCYYEEGRSRISTYNAMVEHMLRCVRDGKKTVAAFYGHPGVFTYPSHVAIRRAREEGFSAQMLPAVSAEDCLFADLGVDPSLGGCQSYEATDFLLSARYFDPSSHLILWQIGVLADWTYKKYVYDTRAMPLLVEKLMSVYPADHEIMLYQAAIFLQGRPIVERIALRALVEFPVRPAMTLYIPPSVPRTPDLDIQSRLLELGCHLIADPVDGG